MPMKTIVREDINGPRHHDVLMTLYRVTGAKLCVPVEGREGEVRELPITTGRALHALCADGKYPAGAFAYEIDSTPFEAESYYQALQLGRERVHMADRGLLESITIEEVVDAIAANSIREGDPVRGRSSGRLGWVLSIQASGFRVAFEGQKEEEAVVLHPHLHLLTVEGYDLIGPWQALGQ